MNEVKVFRGTVRTGRGGAVAEMLKPGAQEGFRRLTGLSVIPGTLNIIIAEPIDLNLLSSVKFTEIGWDFDPAT